MDFVRGAADRGVGDDAVSAHRDAVSRAYGPEAWNVYELLDRSLDPRGPDSLLELATSRLKPGSRVLDVGCRDATHIIELVRATGAEGVGIDPVPRLVEQAREAVAEAGVNDQLEIVEAGIERIPFPDASFDLVWCRDVLEVVADLEIGIAEVARVLRPGGHLIVFTVFATERLEPLEAAMLLEQNLAVVPANLNEEKVEAALIRAGLSVSIKDVVGTEWREFGEERTQPASRDLVRLARLRRQRDEIVEQAGEDIYGHVESNLHWSAYQLLGKLQPTIYVLDKPR